MADVTVPELLASAFFDDPGHSWAMPYPRDWPGQLVAAQMLPSPQITSRIVRKAP